MMSEGQLLSATFANKVQSQLEKMPSMLSLDLKGTLYYERPLLALSPLHRARGDSQIHNFGL